MLGVRQRKPIGLAIAALLMFVVAVLVETVSQPTRVAQAAQTNSYSTFATVSYDGGSCGADQTTSVVSNPGIKKILKISNTEIYVAGCFINFAGVAAADYVAKWNGTSWSGLGASGDINAIVHDIVMYKGDLHIAGEFTDAGGDVAADMVAKWSGSAWVGLPVTGGSNISNGSGSPMDRASGDYAAALKVKENNAGTSDDVLLVGGTFNYGINNGTSGFQFDYTRNIATWNSTTWGSVDTDSEPFTSGTVDYVVHDIEVVGSSIYVSGYRNSATCSSSLTTRKNSFHKFDGTTWTQPITAISCSYFGSGFGIYTMEAVGTDIYVGGTFTSLSSVADHLAVYSTTTNTFSAFNSFSAQFGTGAVVRAITSAGSQLFVGGSFPGAFGTSGGVARWTGSSWQGIGRSGPAVVNALVGDMSYSDSNSRVLIGSSSVNIGNVDTADGFAALEISSTSTLDSVSVDVGTLSPSFDPAVTSYSLTIPNASESVTFTAIASASGAAIKRTNSTGTIAMSSDTEVLSVAGGATENISFAVNSVSGSSSTEYAIAVTRTGASYAITYNANSATSGSVPASGSYTAGGAATTVASNSGTLTRTGYTFAGWNSSANGSGTTYAAGSGTYSTSATITLYAKWTANTLAVTFNSQDGTSVGDGSVTVGAALSVPTAPTRSGFTFSGWSTTSSGSVVSFPYSHGQLTNFTLYAIWASISVSPDTTVAPTTTVAPMQPVISVKIAATATSIAKYAKVSIPAGAGISVKVLSSSSRYCKVMGSSVKGIKKGTCKVTLTVSPKKGPRVTKTVVLKVS